jgi:ribulose 1,5-bisphosphate carboxylase large subunit-like protein
MTEPRPHWLDQPRNVRLLWRGFLAVLALAVAAELVVALHPHFAIEALFGFHALYGFLACAVMIVAAKLLGLLLKRPDTYYGADDD